MTAKEQPPDGVSKPLPSYLQQGWRRSLALRERLAWSLAVGTLSCVFMAMIDASWVRQSSSPPPAISTALGIDAGLLLPFTLLLAIAIGFSSWFLHPFAPPTLNGALNRLRHFSTGRPADVAAAVPLLVLGVFAWATLSAQLARVLLSFDMSPALCGASIALGATTLAALLALAVCALTPWLRQRLAIASSWWRRWIDPAVTLAMALVVVGLLLGFGIMNGTVSGEGGLLEIYGVLKRQELDLRAPVILLLASSAIYLLPSLLTGLRPYQATLIAVVALLSSGHAARALNHEPDLAVAIERYAPLGARPLKLLRRLTDQDGDGSSSWFGGGDCNDSDPAISPAADDIPDNNIDEDCSGSDLSLKDLATAQTPAPSPAPVSLRDRVPKRGNLVLITVDTLRYDLGYMGYPREITPHLDKLANRSVVFERAYALASYTGKSVGPMLIGKYGSETNRNWGHFNKFGEQDRFIAERMQSAGIRTISVHGHRYFGPFGGLERGFDTIDLSAAPPKTAKWAHDSTVTSKKLTDAAIDLLEKQPSDGRFFLWVHYLDPHADYKTHAGIKKFGSKARDMYDNEVAFTDQHIGRLLDYIAHSGEADRTSIIVSSDHGEAFGENNMWRHGFELWEVLVRVPLIVHVPGNRPHRIAARRSHIDLVPTMLDIMRLPVPPPTSEAKNDDFISGVSLLPDIFIDKGSTAIERDILIDMPGGPYNESRRAFIRGELKLIISRGANKELFDLAADPGEKKNIWYTDRKRIEAPYAAFKSRLREIKVTGKRR